ncbi:ActS/PrrB/RegB family redox-sensitive histidine kinase [Xanthobacteraceae bacterium A53D]
MKHLFALPSRSLGLRLDTLIRLRWLAVAGQTLALFVVYVLLAFPVPLLACLAVVALSIMVNVVLRLRYSGPHRLSDRSAGALLGYDVAQLTALLYFTGGLSNPFAFLYLAPVVISATGLSWRTTAVLGVFVIACAGAMGLWHQPLPWGGGDPLLLPDLYLAGIWVSLSVCVGFIGLHSWRVAKEARELDEALAATELVLAREQHLSQLDGLAAAAAHELGTPLATIALVAKELQHSTKPDDPQAEDIALLRDQVKRCRDILQKLTSLGSGDAPFDRMPLRVLIEEVIEPHRDFGVTITVDTPKDEAGEPVFDRNPGLIYGLGNLVENAVDFAASRVEIRASWTPSRVELIVRDDGPGFAPEVSDRIGLPYVTSRARDPSEQDAESGLGLGFFIAKTLLERSGATLSVENRVAPDHGAEVWISWDRKSLERVETDQSLASNQRTAALEVHKGA